jgi:FkbM family methyltransferase
LYETFIEQEYLDLYDAIRPDTELIDIGASIGDTAVYFAMNPNVKKVYSYEPVPALFEIAQQNIASSPFIDKIKLFNIGLGPKHGYADFDKRYIGEEGIRATNIRIDGYKHVEIQTLNAVLKGRENIAIKCDCEKIEEYLFDDANLDSVYVIELEYHATVNKDHILDVLAKKGFIVRITKEQHPKQGLIFAHRE